MSWHRNATGLWCACFLAYQPDDGGGCPAYPCPEAAHTASQAPSSAGELPDPPVGLSEPTRGVEG